MNKTLKITVSFVTQSTLLQPHNKPHNQQLQSTATTPVKYYPIKPFLSNKIPKSLKSEKTKKGSSDQLSRIKGRWI
jgi:N-acetylmuramoyl-L-alanine amidase CwlA